MDTQPTYDINAYIAGYGSLDAAIMAADNDEAYGLLTQLLYRREALREETFPELRAERLRREAISHRVKSNREIGLYGEWLSKAVYRANQGEDELAEQFNAKANAARTNATRHIEQAAAKDAEAEAIERRGHQASALIDIAS